MPKVEIVRHISGSRDGEDWPAVGELLDVPKDEAEDLIRLGIARPVIKGEERAVTPKAEVATPQRKGGLTKSNTGL